MPPNLPYRDAPIDMSAPLEPAGFGIRAGARLVDLLVGYALSAAAGIAVGVLRVAVHGADAAAAMSDRPSRAPIFLAVMGIVAGIAYHTLAEALGGASLGKLVCGLRVLSPGGRVGCSLKSALIRSAGYYIDSLFFGLIGYGAMSKSAWKQRYGDQWADTVVVHARSLPAASRAAPVAGAIAIAAAAYGACVFGSMLVNL